MISDVLIFYPDGRATIERRTTVEAVLKTRFPNHVGSWSTGPIYDNEHDKKIPHLRTVLCRAKTSKVPEEDRTIHLIEVPT